MLQPAIRSTLTCPRRFKTFIIPCSRAYFNMIFFVFSSQLGSFKCSWKCFRQCTLCLLAYDFWHVKLAVRNGQIYLEPNVDAAKPNIRGTTVLAIIYNMENWRILHAHFFCFSIFCQMRCYLGFVWKCCFIFNENNILKDLFSSSFFLKWYP